MAHDRCNNRRPMTAIGVGAFGSRRELPRLDRAENRNPLDRDGRSRPLPGALGFPVVTRREAPRAPAT